MKRWSLPLVIMIAIVTFVMLPYQGHALSEMDKINQQINQLKKDQQTAEQRALDAKANISLIQTEKQEVVASMKALLNQIEEKGKQLRTITEKIGVVSENLEDAGQQLEEAEERVIRRDRLLQSRVRLMYTNGFVSYIEVVLSSTSFSDFLDRYEALKSIVNQDKDILAANKLDRELIEEKKEEIIQQLEEVKQLYAKTEAVREHLLVKEKDREVLIASLDQKEKDFEHISEEQEELMVEFTIKARELQAKKRTIELNYYRGGKLGFPLPDNYRVTSSFGGRTDPITGQRGASHNGTDFGAPGGTSILAAESGEVISATWWNGYGNTVIIDHGNDLWTLYGHIRQGGIKVEEGQMVKRGQKIAEVGTTGRSTGNHLHFEVRLNDRAVDPMKYLK